MITDLFKPGFFVKIYCSLVAVKHGKPDFRETQFLGLFQEMTATIDISSAKPPKLVITAPGIIIASLSSRGYGSYNEKW